MKYGCVQDAINALTCKAIYELQVRHPTGWEPTNGKITDDPFNRY